MASATEYDHDINKPGIRQNSQVACPACGDTRLALYLESPECRFDVAAIGSSRSVFSHGRILRCNACRHGFRENQPSFAELAEIYGRMDVAVYQAEDGSRIRTAARHVSFLQRYARGSELLDVGCAAGLFLERARTAGWHVCGVEPNRELAANATERLGSGTVLNSTFEDAPLQQHAFDAITLWDVLEHVSDPAAVLRRCAGLLRPSGTLLVKVPDLDSATARILGRKWPLLLAEHLNYFTRPSIRALASGAGLQAVSFRRSPVTFSLGYVLYRMSQHKIPATALAHQLLKDTAMARTSLPLYLGELYVFLRAAH
jgi:2-polyprenyl-3-methyl-5-hydroxy-6-metoxy-1,4-benzoquinol methylase